MEYEIKTLSSKIFAQYGGVINAGDEMGFEVFLKEKEKVGWRLAISNINNKVIEKLARHPNTVEFFNPLQGIALICVSCTYNLDDVEVFLVDKPIYIHKNIWHATLSLSGHATLAICENLVVESEEITLSSPLKAVVKEAR
ncbi:hypothetical protein [Bacillus sp. Marseille-P3661]|uniref:hypothetical protein n=1 Tax=Bacillus sp. Marseille-P3661 TaxID=1936234 RepID=UPI000C82D777|nr:hypothetical protein [Bacillus sp. Marseille-P3661]